LPQLAIIAPYLITGQISNHNIMSKISWLLKTGECHFEGSKILFKPNYVPVDTKKSLEESTGIKEKSSVKTKLNSTPETRLTNTEIVSSQFFYEGNISFDYNPKGPNVITVPINCKNYSSPVYIYFNYSRSLVSIWTNEKAAGGFKELTRLGNGVNFEYGKVYAISIKSMGSILEIYIDNIPVIQVAIIITKSQIQITHLGSEVTIDNFKVQSIKPKAFVIMQFGDSYDSIYNDLIKPIVEESGFECIRGDEQQTANQILQDITNTIKESSLIIADITPDNPNVYYELGYAHAVNKPTILLCDSSRKKLPFDVSGFRTLFYDNSISGKGKIERNLKVFIESLFSSTPLLQQNSNSDFI
jgi:hypothetical protein